MKESVQRPERHQTSRTLFVIGLALAATFATLSIAAWRSLGNFILSLEAVLFSLSGVGLSLYALLPGKRKPLARKLILFLGGSAGILFSLLSRNSLDLAGFFMLVLCGAMGAAIVHHLITVIVGPFIFGRIWCAWGCWSAMIFDLLPFGRGPGRIEGRWGTFPVAALAATIGVAAMACYGFGYRGMATTHSLPQASELYWIAVINLLYYLTGISLACVLKDNRAFCKYVCPTSVVLKIGSRFSWLKIAGNRNDCNSCEACTKLCPMDIRIADYVTRGQRVLSAECILCRTCISACPLHALRFSVGLDVGRRENLAGRNLSLSDRPAKSP